MTELHAEKGLPSEGARAGTPQSWLPWLRLELQAESSVSSELEKPSRRLPPLLFTGAKTWECCHRSVEG